MELDRWEQIDRLYHAALERGPDTREAFLDEACAGDEDLRREVAGLLACDIPSDSFIQSPAIEIAARAIAAEPLIETSTNPMGSLIAVSQIGAYQLLEPLGRGGMGEVHLALDTRLGRKVAVKLLPAEFTTDAYRVQRFAREARAVSALNHPNIITVHEIGETATENGSLRYIVTEYVEGETLRQRLRDAPQQRMKPSEAIEVAAQIAAALSAAHEAGITHRDIKPENVMVRRDGIVKVLDFGLAKLTESAAPVIDSQASTMVRNSTKAGVVMGTPRYMSPEQARGEKVDARADIFSLGTVLHEVITGHAPFTGATSSDVIAAILRDDPPPLTRYAPEAPSELEQIVGKALRKDREERYQTIKDLFLDLKRLKQRLEFEAELERSRQPEAPGNVTPRVSDSPEAVETVAKAEGASSPASSRAILDRWRRPRVFILAMLVTLAVALLAFLVVLSKRRSTSHRPSPDAVYWYEQGTNALRDGAYYKASKTLEIAIQIDDKFALAHARLAEAWSELDNIGKAKDEIDRAEALAPDHSSLSPEEALYLQAIANIVKRNFAQAIENYHELARGAEDKEKARVYVDLGRAYEKDDKLNNAKESYLDATRLATQDATAFLRLGVIYTQQQAAEGALEAFQKAETFYQALSNLEGAAEAHYQRGLLFNNLGKLSEASAQLERALEMARTIDSKHQQIKTLLLLARVSDSGGKTTPAWQYATQAIALARANKMQTLSIEGLVNLGQAFFTRGAYTEAENYFKQALDLARENTGRRGEAMAQLALGAFYLQQHKVEEGLGYVEQALTFYQNGGYRRQAARALRWRGRAYYLMGDYSTAFRISEEQLRLAKEVGEASLVGAAHADIAATIADQGRYPEALTHFEQSYAIYESLGNELLIGISLAGRSDMLWRLGRYREARALLDKASSIAESPGDRNDYLRARISLVKALLELSERRLLDAMAAGRLAVALYAGDEQAAEAKFALGLALVLSGAKKEGVRLCNEAVEKASHSNYTRLYPDALMALAQALLESGDAQRARDEALRAQESFARAGHQESNWRAWLLAARACQRAGDGSKVREYASRADASLSNLKKTWRLEAANGYIKRPDIQESLKHLRQLMAEHQ
jgi:serine/threonine protein kinase/Tfp pilus assembly protein PilF